MAQTKSEEPEDVLAVQDTKEDATMDGGLQAWMQVFGAFWIWFNTW